MYLPDKTEHIFYTKIKIEVEYNMYCIQHAEFVCILTVGVKYGIGLKHHILLGMLRLVFTSDGVGVGVGAGVGVGVGVVVVVGVIRELMT